VRSAPHLWAVPRPDLFADCSSLTADPSIFAVDALCKEGFFLSGEVGDLAQIAKDDAPPYPSYSSDAYPFGFRGSI